MARLLRRISRFGSGQQDPGEEELTSEEMFPDPVFRAFVLNEYDRDKDGTLSDAEMANIANAQYLMLSPSCYETFTGDKPIGDNDKIKTLKGVEYFTNLTFAECRDRDLEELDISKNTSLEWLACTNNKLTSLDLSNDTITTVYCQGNPGLVINLGNNADLNRAYAEYLKEDCPTDTDGACVANYCVEVEGYEYPQFKAGVTFSSDETVLFNLSEDNLAVLFPDQTFRTFVINQYDKTNGGNNDGAIDEKEWARIAEEEYLFLNKGAFELFTDEQKPIADDATIDSLEGIQYFRNVTWLNCSGRGITTLDISKNTLLEKLFCADNALTELYVGVDSINQVMCEGNPYLKINLGENAALNRAYAEFLSGGSPVDDDGVCRAETYVEDEESVQFVGGLSFSPDATVIYSEAYEVEIDDPVNMESYWYEILSDYDTDGDGTLSDEELLPVTSVTIDDWYPDSLEGVERLVNLEVLKGEGLYNLVAADLSQNTKLKELTLLGTGLSGLNLSANTALTKVIISGYFEALDFSNNPDLEEIDISGFEDYAEIEFGDLSNLKKLLIYDYPGAELPNFTAATGLTELQLIRVGISSLDVTTLINLTTLTCFDGTLETITGLQELDFLESLNLARNKLTSLDVSALNELKEFYCYRNELTSLKVGTQTFEILAADDNVGLQSINGFENITVTKVLGIGGTGIHTLDVSRFTDLQYLYCYNCGLENLILTDNPELLMLDCSGNNLTSLVISNNTKLFHLFCEKNNIASLDITNNPKLLTAARGVVNENEGVCTYTNGIGGVSYYDEPLSNMLSIDKTTQIIQGENEPSDEEKETIRMFPDPAFRNYVLTNFDKDFNCAIDEDELEAIASCEDVDLSGDGVKDLTGIEYFTEVTNLGLGINELETIDISKNVKLEHLSVARNKLETIDITGIPGLIKAFNGSVQEIVLEDEEENTYPCDCYTYTDDEGDFFSLTVDKGVTVTKTYSEAETATINMFPDRGFRSYILKYFDSNEDFAIDEDELADIAACTYVELFGRNIADLTGIEYFTGMKYLDCSWNQLTKLDLSENTELLGLNCSVNLLTELNISANTKLVFLDAKKNALDKVDISEVHGLVNAYLSDKYEDEWYMEEYSDDEPTMISYPYICYTDYSISAEIDEDTCIGNTLTVDKGTKVISGVAEFTAVGMVLSDEIGLRFVVTVPDGFEFGEYPGVSFMNESEWCWYGVDWSKGEQLDANTYVFTYKLNPLQFADTVTAQIQFGTYTDEDMEYLNDRYVSYSISAEEYCDRLDTDDADESLRHLILSLREYACAVSQSGWSDGYNHAWIEADLSYYTSEEIDRLKEETIDYLYEEGLPAQIDLRDSGVEDVMISLSLLDKTILNIYVLPEDGVEVYGYESTRYIGGQLYYVIKTSPVGPLNLGKMKEIGINTSVGAAMIYACPLSYVYSFLCGSSNEAKNLAMISFFSYYKSACEYDNR